MGNFSPSKWLTIGRKHIEEPPHCPLVGEYSGVIPDAEGLCAKSYADCNNPEVMFYTVFNCANQSEVYEEREYRCFGQWEEDGLVYTYTERKDVPGNECFVGVSVDDETHMVTEAGSNCERGKEPRKYGMTLHRQAKCSHDSPHHHGKHHHENGGDHSDKHQKHPQHEQDSDFSELLVNGETRDQIDELLREEELQFLVTDRPVSPKFGGKVELTSSGGEVVVSEEDLDSVNRPRKVHVNRKRPHHKHGNEDEEEEETYAYDIFSNEIPGSSRSAANSASGRSPSSSVACAVVLLASAHALILSAARL